MKKKIIKISFILVLCIPLLQAMEDKKTDTELTSFFKPTSAIKRYGLTETVGDAIQEQLQVSHTIVKPIPHPDSFYKMHEKLSNMSDKDKRAFINRMSTPLMLLSCASVCLPEEIVKKICIILFDGDKTALEQFYRYSVSSQALDLYYTIEKICDGKPIGPLYGADKSVRNTVLNVLQPSWHLSAPSREEVIAIPKDFKEVYLEGKKIKVLRKGRCACSPGEAVINIGLGLFSALCCAGIFEGIVVLAGLAYGQGAAMACHPIILASNAGVSSCCCIGIGARNQIAECCCGKSTETFY